MKPGLYRVTTHFFVAGFVIGPDGELRECAPIIYKQFARWKVQAEWICD